MGMAVDVAGAGILSASFVNAACALVLPGWKPNGAVIAFCPSELPKRARPRRGKMQWDSAPWLSGPRRP